MIQPDELKGPGPLMWSHGTGLDVWAMFQAAIQGDVAQLDRLLTRDPGLVRAHFEYRTALFFVKLLLARGARPNGRSQPS